MIEVPGWIENFVFFGVIFVVLFVPLKVFWDLTKDTRGRRKRLEGLTERLKERFSEVSLEGGRLAPARIRFIHEGKGVLLFAPSKRRFELRLEETISPKFPVRMRLARWGCPWTWVGGRLLGQVRLGDTAWRIWTTPGFGAYLQELAQEPPSFTDSLIVLRSLPGVRRVDLTLSPSSGLRLRLDLDLDDLAYRPDALEAALHHARAVHHELVVK